MSVISKSFTFSPGATILSSEHNTNFDTLYSLVNGNIDNANIKTAAGIVYSKLALTGSVVLADLDSAILSGDDATLITGTAGTDTYLAKWNSDGDLVDGYAFIDDDTMGTASATNIPSAESVKEYVDGLFSGIGLQSEVFVATSGNWVCPAGKTQVYLTICGGGGGGGGGAPGGPGAGGGGGGAFMIRQAYTVVPTQSYAYVAGAGGAGGAAGGGNGGNGVASSFDSGKITVAGGSGATDQNGASGGAGPTLNGGVGSGGTAGTIGMFGYSGGDGGNGEDDAAGGGGGGSLGPGGEGGNTDGENGHNALGYGGGGGGADDATGSPTGGAGGSGVIIIEY